MTSNGMKKKLIIWSGFVFSLTPVVALAAIGTTTGSTGGLANVCVSAQMGTIGYILCKINQLLTVVIPILVALGVVYFVWGVISYVVAGDEEAKTKGRDRMIYGIIGLAVIVAVWGLVKILTNTFGVSDVSQNITLPTTPY